MRIFFAYISGFHRHQHGFHCFPEFTLWVQIHRNLSVFLENCMINTIMNTKYRITAVLQNLGEVGRFLITDTA